MKRVLARQDGMTLVELMVGLMLTVVLLSGIFGLLSTSLTSWKSGSSRSEIQQTARFAVDSMVRELHYGDSYELENDKSITYSSKKQGNTGNNYRYFVSTTDFKLYRTDITNSVTQPVTGDNVAGRNSIVINRDNEPLFTRPDANTIIITLIATDTFTGHSWKINTAVVSLTQAFK